MLLRCSVNTFFKVDKEFSHKAVEAPKVRATLNAVGTLGIASSALWKLLSSVLSVHFPASGGVELFVCLRMSCPATVNSASTSVVPVSVSRGFTFPGSREELLSGSSEAMDSMNALFRSPKQRAVSSVTASMQL